MGISNLLTLDSSKRFSIDQAWKHSWVRSTVTEDYRFTDVSKYTVSANPTQDIYREAVSRMEALGVKKDTLINDIMQRKRNNLTTCYYLLSAAMNIRNKPPREDS